MIRRSETGVLVDVWVVPGASSTEIAGIHDGAVRIRVAAPAEGGKANRAVARLLQRTMGAKQARLVRGASGRRKTFVLTGVDEATVRSLLP
jgi:uncharacterized protein (TIGR00251 family)